MCRGVKTSLLCCLLLASPACARRRVETNAAAVGDACTLLNGSDIKSIQGEDAAETKGSERTGGALLMSQCYFRLPTFNKSVNLEVIRPAPGGAASAGAVSKYWEERFHNNSASEGEAEREQEERERAEKGRGGAKGERGEEEREQEEKAREASRPQPVSGVGDEAFWVGNQLNASLYVLAKGAVVRVSLGGAEDTPTRIKKTTALAEHVLKRL